MNNENFNFLSNKADQLKDFLEKDFDGMSSDDLMNELNDELKELDDEFKNYKPKITLPFKIVNPDTNTPKYNYGGDSGFDLYSVSEITIEPLGRTLIPTGIALDIKDGYEIQVRSKSGLAINEGLFVLNSPGTVDSGYNDEIKVIIFNTNNVPYTIKKGMKVAQAVLSPVVNGDWVNLLKVDEIEEKDRGNKGFGSTGI